MNTVTVTIEDSVRADERREVAAVIAYFKREYANLNHTDELDPLFDGLLREMKSNWHLMDSYRERNPGASSRPSGNIDG